MSPFALDVMKIAFLALLYFFVYRAVRAVVVDVRGRGERDAKHRNVPAQPPPRRAERRAAKAPTKLIVAGASKRDTRSVPLQSPVQVGRAEGCGLRVDDTYVSQMHARIFPRDGTWFVEDLGSTNGTYLNERKVTEPSEVHSGDRLRVGRTVLELRP